MKMLKNAVYNIAGYAAAMALSIVSVPILLSYMGEARYGIMILIGMLSGFLVFFDFGLGQAIRYDIARRTSDEEKVEVFWTATILSGGLGIVGGVIVAVLMDVWLRIGVEMPAEVRAEALHTLPWVGSMILIATLSGVFSGSLIGQEKFAGLNVGQTIGNIIATLLPILAVIFLGPSLTNAVPALALGRLVSLLIVAVLAFSALRATLRPRLHRACLRPLLSYGGWISAGSFGRQILGYVDRFLVGSILGAAAAALYAVPVNLLQRGGLVPRAVLEVLFPRVAKARPEDVEALAVRALRVNIAIATILSVVSLFALVPVVRLWINPDFAERIAGFGHLAALSILTFAASQVPSMVLRATGRPRITATLLLAEVIPFLVIFYLVTDRYGLSGAVLVVLARGLADFALLSWFAGLLGKFALTMLQALALCGAAYATEMSLPLATPTGIATRLALVAITLGWALWQSADLRKLVAVTLEKVRLILFARGA